MLARQPETARDVRDPPVLLRHIVEGAAITVDLLVDVGPVLDDPPGVVIDHVRKQQAPFGVKAELDLQIDQ